MELLEGRVDVDDVEAFLDALEDIGAETGCTVQAFDARYVLGRPHLERALELADRAVARDENVARDRAVEVLLYAAGRRQIDRALAMGVEAGDHPVVVLVAARRDGATDDTRSGREGDDRRGAGGDADEVTAPAVAETEGEAKAAAEAEGEAGDRVSDLLSPAATLGVEYADPDVVREFFDVAADEVDATDADLQALVLERVALLDVEK